MNLSIKSVEREQRGQGESITYKNLAAGQRITQFRNFLQNGQNKNSLIKFIFDHWGKPSSPTKGKDLYVMCRNLGYMLNTRSRRATIEARGSRHASPFRALSSVPRRLSRDGELSRDKLH